MMIFLTPHVYYGDDNAVKPDDYFGKEVNKILDTYDIDKTDEEKEKKAAEKKIRRSSGKISESKKKDSIPDAGAGSLPVPGPGPDPVTKKPVKANRAAPENDGAAAGRHTISKGVGNDTTAAGKEKKSFFPKRIKFGR